MGRWPSIASTPAAHQCCWITPLVAAVGLLLLKLIVVRSPSRAGARIAVLAAPFASSGFLLLVLPPRLSLLPAALIVAATGALCVWLLRRIAYRHAAWAGHAVACWHAWLIERAKPSHPSETLRVRAGPS